MHADADYQRDVEVREVAVRDSTASRSLKPSGHSECYTSGTMYDTAYAASSTHNYCMPESEGGHGGQWVDSGTENWGRYNLDFQGIYTLYLSARAKDGCKIFSKIAYDCQPAGSSSTYGGLWIDDCGIFRFDIGTAAGGDI
ncbi:hypothetical protein DL96DRAFT_1683078 [Flagelloscypha sp. PMI_526]|nr:hypothetical protein DL96DRAFT_1683078 [Flagelloscypha sp. PMI_526]